MQDLQFQHSRLGPFILQLTQHSLLALLLLCQHLLQPFHLFFKALLLHSLLAKALQDTSKSAPTGTAMMNVILCKCV